MKLSLRLRLALTTLVLFGLLVIAVSALTYGVLVQQLDRDTADSVTRLADGLQGYLRLNGDTLSLAFDANDDDEAAFVHEATRYYQVFDSATGRLLAASPAMAPLGLDYTPPEIEALRTSGSPEDVSTSYGRLRFVTHALTLENRPLTLVVGVPLTQMDRALSRYRNLLLLIVPIALLITAAAVWWISGYALRPLSRMALETRAIDVSTLDRRLAVRGAGDELDEVASAFNAALERLEHAVGEMRQFSAALAHELRTPLAALRGGIELGSRERGLSEGAREAAGSQLEEIDRLARLIDQILTQARAEAGQIHLTFAPVDLGELACSVIEDLESLADARSIRLGCEPKHGVVVKGDAGWLRRLLINLVDNALKFTPEGGRVTVRVTTHGETAAIDVEDTGIGLTREDAARVFERFFRADPSRTSRIEGAGLGLSLVQWVAAQHHGTVSVTSQPGAGTTFTVILPRAT